MYIDDNNVAHEDFKLYTFNTYDEYIAAPRWFFEICQEAAALHSDARHLGIPDLLKQGRTWVITREKMTVSRYPHWGETVHMQTAVPKADSFFAPRTMRALDGQGNEILRSSTMWAVLDAKTRVPVKVSEIYGEIGAIRENTFVDENLRRAPRPDAGHMLEKECIAVFRPQVFFFDCDINNHINNIVYLDWMLRALPFSYLGSHRPCMIDIMWMHEVHMDDQVEVRVHEMEKDRFGFIVQRVSDSTRVCIAEIEFRDSGAMV